MPDTPIFICHASSNKALVDAFLDLLVTGIGLHPSQIFCSSVQGLGIQGGEPVSPALMQGLAEAKVFILLLTKEFRASPWCQQELGIIRFTKKRYIPFLVPPLSSDDMKGVLEGVQCLSLNRSADLDQLCSALKPYAGHEIDVVRWGDRRNSFLEKLDSLLVSPVAGPPPPAPAPRLPAPSAGPPKSKRLIYALSTLVVVLLVALIAVWPKPNGTTPAESARAATTESSVPVADTQITRDEQACHENANAKKRPYVIESLLMLIRMRSLGGKRADEVRTVYSLHALQKLTHFEEEYFTNYDNGEVTEWTGPLKQTPGMRRLKGDKTFTVQINSEQGTLSTVLTGSNITYTGQFPKDKVCVGDINTHSQDEDCWSYPDKNDEKGATDPGDYICSLSIVVESSDFNLKQGMTPLHRIGPRAASDPGDFAPGNDGHSLIGHWKNVFPGDQVAVHFFYDRPAKSIKSALMLFPPNWPNLTLW